LELAYLCPKNEEALLSYRVLLVDDYEPWRRYVDARVTSSPQWQIAGEAADGLDAVHKAEALRPDLILLDIGLPSLNGIAAARRILAHDPGSRILFLSENSSWDIVEAALSTGGRGYVLKSDAGSELLPAMESIVEGRQFLSSSLKRQDSATKVPQPIAGLHHPARAYHGAGFYSDDESLLEEYLRFAEATLNAGKVLIVSGIDSRRPSLEKKLGARGFDLDRLAREGRYRWRDVAEAIETLLVKDWPDEARFWSVLPRLIKQAAAASTAKHPRVALWGECAPTLWRQGKAEAAIRLEQLWDELVRAYGVDTLCAYPSNGSLRDESSSVFQRICAAHSSIHSR
jgi:DNA-binding NarL/FixJ family response regulator